MAVLDLKKKISFAVLFMAVLDLKKTIICGGVYGCILFEKKLSLTVLFMAVLDLKKYPAAMRLGIGRSFLVVFFLNNNR